LRSQSFSSFARFFSSLRRRRRFGGRFNSSFAKNRDGRSFAVGSESDPHGLNSLDRFAFDIFDILKAKSRKKCRVIDFQNTTFIERVGSRFDCSLK